ncbi:MAG TPA: hypothetical protein VNV87_12270 [Acidimicrobiales bacterium]|nr:hypothetical protein [Acidimicrobiales bacterium]
MNDTPLPPYLKPKATKLPAGHDDTLDPPAPPTDSEQRQTAPFDWAQFDKSKGTDGPPDAPLAPPATDSSRRSTAPFVWPRSLPQAVPNRPLRELVAPVPDLDPDIALWPVTILSRWPFAGPPAEGIWPKGWMGADSDAAVWVCTVAGEPGTWRQIGAAGPAGGWPTNNGTGPGNLTAATPGGDTVGYNITDNGSGGITLDSEGTANLALISKNALVVEALGGAAHLLIEKASGGSGDIIVQQNGNGAIQIIAEGSGDVSLTSVGGDVSLSGTQLLVGSLPTSDPSVSEAVWNDNGVVVLSGSTTPLGDTGWANLTLINGWTDSGGWARYRRVNGIVYVQVSADGGSANQLATLPAGFRPGESVIVATDGTSGGNPIFMTVNTGGDVIGEDSTGAVPGNILAGTVSFPADA